MKTKTQKRYIKNKVSTHNFKIILMHLLLLPQHLPLSHIHLQDLV